MVYAEAWNGEEMTGDERYEVHTITERLNRIALWARWILGLLFVLMMSVGTYMFTLDLRLTTMESNTEQTIENLELRLEEAGKRAMRNRAQAESRGRELSKISERMESQSKTLDRIDETLSEMTRFLRRETAP